MLRQVDNLQLISGNRGVSSGAWGVWIKNGADMLVKNLNAQARMVRDITVQGLQPGTAIVNSKCCPLNDQEQVHTVVTSRLLGAGCAASAVSYVLHTHTHRLQ